MPRNRPTTKFRTFAGLNNVLLPEEMDESDLTAADNVLLTDNGRLIRRAGYQLNAAGKWHSLQNAGDYVIAVKDGDLVSLSETLQPTTIRAGVGEQPVDADVSGGRVFWSNGVSSGIWDGTTDRPWGVKPPGPPAIEEVSGGLEAGTYKVQLTYKNSLDEESGASLPVWSTVSDNGALRIHLPSASGDATEVAIYVSHCDDSSVFFFRAVAVGTATVDMTSTTLLGRELMSRSVEPPPVSSIVVSHYGRMLCVDGNKLLYSEPFAPSWFKPTNFVEFPSNITDAASVEGGVYVSSDKTYFLAGKDISSATAQDVVADSQIVRGTVVDLYPGDWPEIVDPHKAWVSTRGIVLATPGGQVAHATEARYQFPVSGVGSLCLVKREGIAHLLSVMKDSNEDDNVFAVGDRVTATVIRNGVTIS